MRGSAFFVRSLKGCSNDLAVENNDVSKKDLSERDICTKFITPAIVRAGWDVHSQIREEVGFTKGRIIVRGKLVTRGKAKRADYMLYYKPNIPLALVEARDNNHAVGDGMQQGLDYGATLDIPFVFSSNGDGFLFHDRTGRSGQIETELFLDAFPSPADLWTAYRAWKGLAPTEEAIVLQNYFEDAGGKEPRYYQTIAINRAIEAIAKGLSRILLVMATGTGKTYTAFQIIWRLWKAGRKKRILFLADRNVLVDQTMVNDFRPFGAAMAKLSTGSKTIEREDGIEVQLPTAVDKKHAESTPPTRSTWPSTRPSPAPRTARSSSASCRRTSSTSSWWTNATVVARPRTRPGGRSSTTSPRPPRSA
jgi:type I restriction enzyme R subunit